MSQQQQPDSAVIDTLTVPPSSSTPTPAPAPAPTPAPAAASESEELTQLREWRRATTTVMDTSAPGPTRLRAAEVILRHQGYNDQEVETHMAQMRAQMDGTPQSPPAPETDDAPLEGGDDLRQQLEETRRLAEQANESVRLQRAEKVSAAIQGEVGQIVNNTPDAQVFWDALTRFHGDPAKVTAARNTIQDQILANAKQSLLKRAQTARTFEERWIQEEVKKAADTVFNGYRTVIGDPGQLGRAPETGGGPSGVRVVDVPEPKKGSGSAPALEKQLEDWTNSELMKLASRSGTGKSLV